MQHARCAVDGEVWEAEKFAVLPAADLDAKRRSLSCVQCDEFAWFRKESTHGHPAHFCAHHKDDCDLKVNYVVVDDRRGEPTSAEEEVAAGDDIVVRLDQERGTEVDVAEVQAPPLPGAGGGGRTFAIPGQARESAQHFTLRRILLRLIQSPDFRTSRRQIALYKDEKSTLVRGEVRHVVAAFDEVQPIHNGGNQLFWGPIASAGRTADGKIWLNSSARYQGVSVAIFQDIAEEFLSAFNIADLDDLAGAHILVAATCYVATTGKIVLYCASPKNIVVRRYRDARLQAEL